MNFLRNNIPNTITSLNLLCGLLAIYNAFCENTVAAAFLVILAAIFDFFDGFAARALKSKSTIGKDLDSLADMVTFGAAPAFIYLAMVPQCAEKLCGIPIGTMGGNMARFAAPFDLLVFLIPIFSAVRLAKFNNDTRQTENFIGLPTPANALLFISFPLIRFYQPHYFPEFVLDPNFMGAISVLSAYLMNSKLMLFSMKFKTYGFAENRMRYIFLALSLAAIIIFKFASIPVIIALYIGLSFIQMFTPKKRTA